MDEIKLIYLCDIKSPYIRDKIFLFLKEKRKLELAFYNKKLQKKFGIEPNFYKILNGKYIIEDENGKVKEYLLDPRILVFEGEYLNGIKWNGKGYNQAHVEVYTITNGKGYIKEYNANGELCFKGDYLNGKIKKGKEYNHIGTLIYEGQYFYGKRNGIGIEYYFNGDFEFEGEFINGKNGKEKEKNITHVVK